MFALRAGVRSKEGGSHGSKEGGKEGYEKEPEEGGVDRCSVCGLAVTVDGVWGCVNTCDIICCDKQMKPKKRT